MAKSNKNKTDLNSLTLEALKANIADAQLRLKKLKFSHAITPIDNPKSISITRKEVAQLKTALRRKQLGF